MRGNVLLARLRSSRGRRLAVAVFAVPAILVGLLAMHGLITDGMSGSAISVTSETHHDSTEASHLAAVTMAATMSTPVAPAPADDCGGMCEPGHEMLGMICGLALLITVVLLSLQLILTSWHPLKRVVVVGAIAAALASHPSPSLHVLSISRT